MNACQPQPLKKTWWSVEWLIGFWIILTSVQSWPSFYGMKQSFEFIIPFSLKIMNNKCKWIFDKGFILREGDGDLRLHWWRQRRNCEDHVIDFIHSLTQGAFLSTYCMPIPGMLKNCSFLQSYREGVSGVGRRIGVRGAENFCESPELFPKFLTHYDFSHSFLDSQRNLMTPKC